MTKPSEEDKERSFRELLAREDEIEILEVIGLDDEDPVASGDAERDGRDGESEPAEVVLDLDAEAATEVEAEPRPSAPVESAGLLRDQLVRLQADFDNYKKRMEREREAFRRSANADLVERLLHVLDNFERAVAASLESDGDSTFRDGVVLIFRQLLEELRKEGLSSIDSLGEPFDPTRHEAVATDPQSDLPANTVVEELQRGYLLHDRLLRPARVRVSTTPPSSGDEGER